MAPAATLRRGRGLGPTVNSASTPRQNFLRAAVPSNGLSRATSRDTETCRSAFPNIPPVQPQPQIPQTQWPQSARATAPRTPSPRSPSPSRNPSPKSPRRSPSPSRPATTLLPPTRPAEKTPKKEKKDKKEKKEKKESGSKKRKADEVELTNGDDNEANDAKVKKEDGAADVKAPKAKKSKKAKRAAAEGDETAVAAEGEEVAGGDKKNRFIVFVGNLPYTANAATIRQHFASVKPEGVRCLTKDGKENTCRGFAFIEFTHPTNMRTCLDKLHHSIFNDGLSPARKINVELT